MTNSFWTNLIHTRLTLFLQKAFVDDTYKPHKVKKKKTSAPRDLEANACIQDACIHNA